MPLRAPNGEVWLTTKEAAALCKVQPITVRQWVARGHLEPVGRAPAGGTLYFRQVDLARAEAKVRCGARESRAGLLASLERELAESLGRSLVA